jgi:hypothetical protein
MAAPTITLLNHTELDDADDNTGWVETVTAETDIKVEGVGSLGGILRADGETAYYDNGSAPSTAVGKTLRGWILSNNIPYMGTMAADPYKLIAYDGTITEKKDLFGSDTYPGGWFNFIWDMDEFTTLTLANVQRWGVEAGHAVSAKNVINTWMDVLRYLDGYSMTGGTSGDEVMLSDIAIYDKGTTTLRGYNVLAEFQGVFFCTGAMQFGTGATTHYFLMDGEILVFVEANVAAGLYSLSGVGTGTDVVIKNSVIRSTGATDATRFVFDWSDTDLGSCEITDNFIVRASACTFQSGQTITGNTFDDCGQIDAGGADLTGSVVQNYEGTTDTGALSWTPATDPNGELDNMSFTKGTAATHAIEFGILSPLTMTLTGIDFSGYNAADAQTDSALLIRRTTGTVNIALVGCTGTIKYKSLGATVILTASKSATFTPIEDGSAFTITKNSDNSILEDVASTTGGEVVYSYDGSLDGTLATVHIIIAGKEPIDFPWTVAEGTVPVSQVTDRVYSNP